MAKRVHTLPEVPHAKLSASSAERWLECPGSIRLAEGVPDTSKFYNVEGTVAHHVGERVLSGAGCLLDELGRVYEQDGIQVEVTHEMLDAVQVYIETVAADKAPHGVVYSEANLTPGLAQVDPDFGGISDAIVVDNSPLLRVYDYKHGAGIWVPAAGNKQLKYYALGATLKFPERRFSEVEVVVVQPRCGDDDDSVRRWRFDAYELLEFEAELVDGAAVTRVPDAPANPGEWCRLCRARPTCPALKAKQAMVLNSLLPPVSEPTDDQLAEWLKALGPVEHRIKAIRELAYDRAVRGQPPTGYKMVPKRGRRRYKDVSSAKAALAQVAEAWEEPKEPRLLTPAQLERALGKKQYREVGAELVHMVSSGYTLVEESDKRSAITDVSPDMLSKLD